MPVKKSRAVKDHAHTVDAPSTAAENDNAAASVVHGAANDNEAAVPAQAAISNDDPTVPAQTAANDNEATAAAHGTPDNGTGIRVTDDLPRPLPVIRGEGEIVWRLLGERFLQILLGKEKL